MSDLAHLRLCSPQRDSPGSVMRLQVRQRRRQGMSLTISGSKEGPPSTCQVRGLPYGGLPDQRPQAKGIQQMLARQPPVQDSGEIPQPVPAHGHAS